MPTHIDHRIPQSAQARAYTSGGSPKVADAVVGAGIMGTAMATRLLDRGIDVAVWSRRRWRSLVGRWMGRSRRERRPQRARAGCLDGQRRPMTGSAFSCLDLAGGAR